MRLFILLIVLWLIPLALRCQDIRLSAEEPSVFSLPNEYRIESGDSLGGRVLVVWGTTRSSGLGSVVGELRYQMLDGGTVVGTQHPVTDTNADPYAHVQVISLASSFLVVWMDRRRDVPGLYIQRISLDGQRVGQAERIGGEIAPQWVYGKRVFVVGTREGGRMVLWHEVIGGRTRLNGVHFTPGGNPELPARDVGGILQQELHFGSYPGMTILRMEGSTVMADRFGRIDERPINDTLLRGPYHLNEDTSLLMVRGKNLERYPSLFAESAEWSVPIPALDSAAANTVMVGRDSTGEMFVLFTTIRNTGNATSSGFFTMATWKVPIARDGQPSFNAPQLLYHDDIPNGAYNLNGRLYAVQTISFQQGCDHSSVVRIETTSTIIYHGTLGQSSPVLWSLSLDGKGVFRDNDSGYAFRCDDPFVSVHRGKTDSDIVVMQSDGDSTALKSPIASHHLILHQLAPCLTFDGDRFLCSWMEGTNGAVLSTLPRSFVGNSLPLDTVKHSFPEVKLYGTPGYELLGEGVIQQKEGFQAYGTMIVDASNYSKYYDTRLAHPTELLTTRAAATAFRLYKAGGSGWDPLFIRDQVANPGLGGYAARRYDGRVVGYNPDKEWLLVGIHEAYYDYSPKLYPDTVYLVSKEGKILRQQPNLSTEKPAYWMPVDQMMWLLIQDESGLMCRNNDTLYRFSLPRGSGSPRITPLNGSSFLRAYRSEMGSDKLILEIYNLEGTLMTAGFLRTTSESLFSSNPLYLQRPSDSGLVVLWGTEDDGVHAALLDRNLNVVVADTVVSATRGKAINPSGVFRGDSLYIVWEDYRNGEADIYGAATLFQSTSVVGVEDRSEIVEESEVRVWPNPSRDGVWVELDGERRENVELDLYDMLGKVVWRGHVGVGSGSRHVRIESMHSGAYRLSWRSGDRSGAVPVMVVR